MKLCDYSLLSIEVYGVWRYSTKDWCPIPYAEPTLVYAGRKPPSLARVNASSNISWFTESKENGVQRLSDRRLVEGTFISVVEIDMPSEIGSCQHDKQDDQAGLKMENILEHLT